jgi:hypothetical protein
MEVRDAVVKLLIVKLTHPNGGCLQVLSVEAMPSACFAGPGQLCSKSACPDPSGTPCMLLCPSVSMNAPVNVLPLDTICTCETQELGAI